MDVQINHDAANRRFFTVVEGVDAHLDYRLADGVMTILHTGVPAEIGGRGIAGALVQAAFEHAREAGLKVDPRCSYSDAWLRRHPGFGDLRA